MQAGREQRTASDARPLGPPTLTRRQALAASLVAGGAAAVGPARAFALGRAASGGAPSLIPPGLDAQIAALMDMGKIPGLSAAVIRRQHLVWTGAFGSANLWRHDRVRRDTLFMLASISKTLICTAVMQAVEAGVVDLDEDVNGILPFPVRTPEHPHRAITLRQLLTHTSSIRDRWPVWDDLYVRGDSPIALGAFLQGYLVPGGEDYDLDNFLGKKPGSVYRYSNIGASLAAFVVEAASGIGFDTWCRDRIFAPLGMTRAGWHLADVPAEDVAMPYRWSGPRQRYVGFGQYGYPDYPDGALRTTAPQLARHMGMMLNGGSWQGTRVLRSETVREILRSQVPDITVGQGLIWYRAHTQGRLVIGHNGGDQGVATVAFFDPAEEIGVIALANSDWRRVDRRWPLQQIMNLLFDRAQDL